MYLTKTLSDNEEIKYVAKLHWINYIIPIITSFIVIGIIPLLRLLTTEMVCTTKRVIFKKGIISVTTDELRNIKIESVSVRQTIMGRILGYGNIIFTGSGNQQVIFCSVSSPAKIKANFESVIELSKE